jgi:subtilisin
MVGVDERNPKYIIMFKRKDQRSNKIDDKFELFRHIVGLRDVNDILDLLNFKGDKMTQPIQKSKETVTDINSYKRPVIIARLTEEQAIALAKNPDVYSIQKERFMTHDAQTTPWGITKVRAPEAWNVATGKGVGVKVAIIDTGCNHNHPDLKENVKVKQVFSDDSGTTLTNEKYFDHGTHVAGTVAAVANDVGVVGVAPKCELWNLKVFGKNGLASDADLYEGLQYAQNNKANVFNLSLGFLVGDIKDYADTATAHLFLDSAEENNSIHCSSAGNEAKANVQHMPSGLDGVEEISAIDSISNLASFSNSGPHTDYTGPGVGILSTLKGDYGESNGTSMSCPHVTGMVALAFAAYKDDGCNPIYQPVGTPKHVVILRALKQSCTKLGKFTTERTNAYGYGMPQADKLVKILMGIQ